MKLFIDTSSNLKTRVSLDDEMIELDSDVWHSQTVLPMIIQLLKDKGKSLQDLSEVLVNIGPGSYTGLRVGVSIANALGYALKIPVNGKEINENQIIQPEI